ncbi:exodeoxyribonuclease VII small subunit [Candidatus Saccharibacteria bacterium]|nr:exodeoxyribonuclease VII small subunit [Candidatus Saccharibacteria bacterium]
MKDKSYKQIEAELSQILSRIESGNYDDLDMIIKDYDAGKKLIAELQKRIDTAKNRIKKVN